MKKIVALTLILFLVLCFKLNYVWLPWAYFRYSAMYIYASFKPPPKLSEQEAIQIAEAFLGKKIPGLNIPEDEKTDSTPQSVVIENKVYSFRIDVPTRLVTDYSFLLPEQKRHRQNLTNEQAEALRTITPEQGEKLALDFAKTHFKRFYKGVMKLVPRDPRYAAIGCCGYYEWEEYKPIGKYLAKLSYSNVRIRVSLIEGVVERYEGHYPEIYEANTLPSLYDDLAYLPKEIPISQEKAIEIVKQNKDKIGFEVLSVNGCCSSEFPLELIILPLFGRVLIYWYGIACGSPYCGTSDTQPVFFLVEAFTGKFAVEGDWRILSWFTKY